METQGAGANPERPRQMAPTLDAFAALAAQGRGLALSALSPIDQIEVRTRNTTYRITLLGLQDARVLVQGGKFFPVPGEAHLSGSTLGGSMLKLGWIGCGFCMELNHEGRRIVTTRVREIRRVPTAASSTLH
jgi:hypothetical protein